MEAGPTATADDRPVVLVVEDEAIAVMDLVDVLEEAGYSAVPCASAERAIGILDDGKRVDALITDVELAGKIDGFALARLASELQPAMPIVIVSGRAVPGPDKLPRGARFVARPCLGDDILDALRTAIDERRES